MGKIGIISPIKKQHSSQQGYTLSASLSREGLTKWPTCGITLFPYKEKDGTYRNGLDPDALYIRQMAKISPSEAAKERAYVTAIKEELELATGLNLSPKSDFYTDMMNVDLYNTNERARMIKLIDDDNKFNLSDAFESITYHWLRVYPTIAPSYNTWQKGIKTPRCPIPSQCTYYVKDEEFESGIIYEQKTLINKAIAELLDMNPTKQLKVAILLGLPVTSNSKPEMIYNALDNFIQESAKGDKTNINLFNAIAKVSDETLSMKYIIKRALLLNVYRKNKSAVYDGDVKIGVNEDAALEYLIDPKNQDEYLALEERIKAKQLMEV
jgi:hypothetical protein